MTNSRRANDAAAIKALRKQIASARPATSRRSLQPDRPAGSRRGRRGHPRRAQSSPDGARSADDGALSTAVFDANDSASLKLTLWRGRLSDAEHWIERAGHALRAGVEPATELLLHTNRALFQFVRGCHGEALGTLEMRVVRAALASCPLSSGTGEVGAARSLRSAT
jgi:hypothetical protein